MPHRASAGLVGTGAAASVPPGTPAQESSRVDVVLPAPMHQVTATVALGRAVRKHPFLEAAHHPFIAGISHICSPLSAALLVFGIHKWWQANAMRAWWEARRTVHSPGPGGSASARPAGSAGVTGGSGVRHPTPPSGARFFSTSSRFRPGGIAVAAVGVGAGIGSLLQRRMWGVKSISTRTRPLEAVRMHSSLSCNTQPTTRSMQPRVARPVAFAVTLPVGPCSRVPDCSSRNYPATAGVTAAAAAPIATASASSAEVGAAVGAALPSLPSASPSPTLVDIYGAEDVPLVLDHLSHWWSVVQMQDLMSWMHTAADLPWWGSIAAATIVLRLLAMPFEVVMLRNSLRMKQILPDVERLQAKMTAAGTPEEKRLHAQALLQLFKDKKCSPMHGLYIPLLFPPVFLSLFGATHNLALAEPTMTAGGALWFVDLVLPDPTWMLPVASSLTWLALLERTAGYFYLSNSNFRSFCRTLAVAFIPVVANMPAGVFCFWLTSNLFSLLRVAILNQDSVRRVLRIPLRSEVAALAHVPRPLDEQLTPVELRALVQHAKQLAHSHSK